MPKMKKNYKDNDRFIETRNRQRKRYYRKTATFCKVEWTAEQEKLVLEHSMTDTELSAIIGHSVQAIQIRRYKLKNGK